MESSPFKAAAEGLVDAIYSRFLLRDMVGKVVPGSILLFTIIGSYLESNGIKEVIAQITFFVGLALFSLAWVTAFSIQSFGERLGWIRYFPKKIIKEGTNEGKPVDDKGRFKGYYQKIILFNKYATPLERMERERLLVIRESCGNTYVSLIFSFAVYILAYSIRNQIWVNLNILHPESREFIQPLLPGIISVLPAVISILPAIICLRYMHFQYVARHDEFLKAILSLNNISVDQIEDEFVRSTFDKIYNSIKEGKGISVYSLAEINFTSDDLLKEISTTGIIGAAKFDYEFLKICKWPHKLHISRFDLIKEKEPKEGHKKDLISGRAHVFLVASSTTNHEFRMSVELDDKNYIKSVAFTNMKSQKNG